MKMYNNPLIINGIDHSVFNPDWAEKGGIVNHNGLLCKYITEGCNTILSDSYLACETLLGYENTLVLINITTLEKDFPPPTYDWQGDMEDKPDVPSSDDWEYWDIRGNVAIVCNANGFITEGYEWFGEWYYYDHAEGDIYPREIVPTHYQSLPKPPKD